MVKLVNVDVLADTPLLVGARDSLGLVGTKYGCGIAQCGACTVHMSMALPFDHVPYLFRRIGDKKITTIEGLSEKGDHPVQLAWHGN
jgi:isoquinoline 1-oxidoreductase alpha subunit